MSMRLLHRFLFWFPLWALGAVATFVGLAIAAAQVWPAAKIWDETQRDRAFALASEPISWILAAIAVATWAYLIWFTLRARRADARQPSNMDEFFREFSAQRKAEALADALYGPRTSGSGDRGLPGARTADDTPYAPILFAGFVEAKDTPQNDHTAIRVVVRNQTDESLTGLVARLVRAEPDLGSLNGPIELPLVLETKARLDRFRNPKIQEQFPPHGFNLPAHSDKQIEVVWLHSKGALEGYITHEAGEASFLFVGTQELYVEVTGAGRPIVAGVRINVSDDDIQSWTLTLILEAVGAAHGKGSVGSGF
jgi:hypothetical protein